MAQWMWSTTANMIINMIINDQLAVNRCNTDCMLDMTPDPAEGVCVI